MEVIHSSIFTPLLLKFSGAENFSLIMQDLKKHGKYAVVFIKALTFMQSTAIMPSL